MAGIANPEAFLLANFAPSQTTGGAEEAFENFRVVTGMENN